MTLRCAPALLMAACAPVAGGGAPSLDAAALGFLSDVTTAGIYARACARQGIALRDDVLGQGAGFAAAMRARGFADAEIDAALARVDRAEAARRGANALLARGVRADGGAAFLCPAADAEMGEGTSVGALLRRT